MWKDPMAEEIRRIGEEHAAEFDYDLKKIFEDLKRRELESGMKFVSLPPRKADTSS